MWKNVLPIFNVNNKYACKTLHLNRPTSYVTENINAKKWYFLDVISVAVERFQNRILIQWRISFILVSRSAGSSEQGVQ